MPPVSAPEGARGPSDPASFDRYASSYGALHQQSIAASGESPEYFARYKIECLRRAAAQGPVLDYGCGVGSLTELLTEAFDAVSGYDPSFESLTRAAERAPRATLTDDPNALPDDHFESVILAGVLHHVPPPDRPGVLDTVRRKLRPGGRIFVFEHNPLNPLTRRAVADCPFDEDAVLLWPWQLRRTLARAGFARVDLDYIVFFPKPLAFLRSLEPRLAWCALGAQTLTCGRRP